MTSESYHRSHVWRQGARPGVARDMLSGQAAPVLFGLSALLVIIFPWVWLPLLLAAALYAGWLSTQRYQLPMRLPLSWQDIDPGDPLPGPSGRCRDAAGMIYLGIDDEGQELWLSNSDARRHIFALGTTGSGKTEFLLGLVAQPLMWGSGFLFVDGKGTPEFYARVWALAKRFGREDDVRLVNFTGVSAAGAGGGDASAGSMGSQSNTLNPFSRGTADQLINMVASLMSSGGSSGEMWRDRAVQFVSMLLRTLVEMRDRGEILLDVQTIRDFMPLGEDVLAVHPVPEQKDKAPSVNDLKDTQWDLVRDTRSASALYLRSLNGDFTQSTTLALKGFFDSLPGFSLAKLLHGKSQNPQTSEQYGYLSMQLTAPLGTMADDYSHIFRTPLAEVDMEDVVYRRRILVVLLPALQKAAEETRNLGKIVVSMSKAMMGSASGSEVVGTREDIIESAPTRSTSPFMAVFDEAGYYLVQGMDVMAAQARSLGFSIIIGAQDIQAMRSDNPQVANSVIANTFLTAVGATVDADATLSFIRQKVGEMTVAMNQTAERISGLFGVSYRESPNLSYQATPRVDVDDLRQLTEGQFYFVFRNRVVRGRSFYIGDAFTPEISINSFVRLEGPPDSRAGQADWFEHEMQKAATAAAAGSTQSGHHLNTNTWLAAARHPDGPPAPPGFASPMFGRLLDVFVTMSRPVQDLTNQSTDHEWDEAEEMNSALDLSAADMKVGAQTRLPTGNEPEKIQDQTDVPADGDRRPDTQLEDPDMINRVVQDMEAKIRILGTTTTEN